MLNSMRLEVEYLVKLISQLLMNFNLNCTRKRMLRLRRNPLIQLKVLQFLKLLPSRLLKNQTRRIKSLVFGVTTCDMCWKLHAIPANRKSIKQGEKSTNQHSFSTNVVDTNPFNTEQVDQIMKLLKAQIGTNRKLSLSSLLSQLISVDYRKRKQTIRLTSYITLHWVLYVPIR
ncbi:hypothetical protein SDJN02_11696, partial [Cucurbita argyrosperma subsp. argyrosperma]